MDRLSELVDIFRPVQPDELLAAKAEKREPDMVYSYTISVWGRFKAGHKMMFNIEGQQVPGYAYAAKTATPILATAVLASVHQYAGSPNPGWSNGMESAWPDAELFHVEHSPPFGQRG